jgi:putative ABC transport system substrate-binding protein
VARIGRRQFLSALAAASAAVPAAARAQGRPRRIAWLATGVAGAPSSPFLDNLRQGLREHGWEEGRNLTLTPFWTHGSAADAEPVVRRMLASNPELVVAHGRDVLVLHGLKPTLPVVFGFSANPVDAGFAQSFAHPGGNFTGV